MDSKIERLLKDRNIHIEYADVDFQAQIFDTPKGPVIIVNKNIIDDFLDWVTTHEIGHDKFDQFTTGSYRNNDAVHTKMEYNANKYMVTEMFDKYLSTECVDIEDINPVEFLEQRGLDLKLEPILRKIILEKTTKRTTNIREA